MAASDTPELPGLARYGNLYWCVKTPLSEVGEIYLYGDRMALNEDGSLLFYRYTDSGDGEAVNMAFAPGQWKAVYAASAIDGSPVAVTLWEGEMDA